MWQGPSPKMAWLLVLTVNREAARATLLEAVELFVAEMPGNAALVQVPPTVPTFRI